MANLPAVTDSSFKQEVLDQEGAVLVDFWATWCGPCRVLHPVLEEISAERDDVKIISLDIDENQSTAAQYEVLSVPTMILFKDGEAAAIKIGAGTPKAGLTKWIEANAA